jgi:hypothetical protein
MNQEYLLIGGKQDGRRVTRPDHHELHLDGEIYIALALRGKTKIRWVFALLGLSRDDIINLLVKGYCAAKSESSIAPSELAKAVPPNIGQVSTDQSPVAL